jgi:hypothetical protein
LIVSVAPNLLRKRNCCCCCCCCCYHQRHDDPTVTRAQKSLNPRMRPLAPTPSGNDSGTIAEFFGMLASPGLCNDVVAFQAVRIRTQPRPDWLLVGCTAFGILPSTSLLACMPTQYQGTLIVRTHTACRSQPSDQQITRNRTFALSLQSSSYWHVHLSIRAHWPLRDSPRLLHMDCGSPANQTLERVRWVIPQPHLLQLIPASHVPIPHSAQNLKYQYRTRCLVSHTCPAFLYRTSFEHECFRDNSYRIPVVHAKDNAAPV